MGRRGKTRYSSSASIVSSVGATADRSMGVPIANKSGFLQELGFWGERGGLHWRGVSVLGAKRLVLSVAGRVGSGGVGK